VKKNGNKTVFPDPLPPHHVAPFFFFFAFAYRFLLGVICFRQNAIRPLTASHIATSQMPFFPFPSDFQHSRQKLPPFN